MEEAKAVFWGFGFFLAMAAGVPDCPAQTGNARPGNVPPSQAVMASQATAGATNGNVSAIIEARLVTFRQMLPQYVTSQRDEAENRMTIATANKPLIDTYGGVMSCNIVSFLYSNETSPRTICLHLTSQAKTARHKSDHGVDVRRDDAFFSPNVLKYDIQLVAGAGTVEQIFSELTRDQLRDLAFAKLAFVRVGSDTYEIPADLRQSWRLLWTYFELNRARLAAQTGSAGPLPPVTREETDFRITTQAQERVRNAALNKALQANLAAAAQGDAYGLLRMGERYRDGEGVEVDLKKAREYLEKAAAAGSPTAAEELSALPKR